jgi:hypothetical protein
MPHLPRLLAVTLASSLLLVVPRSAEAGPAHAFAEVFAGLAIPHGDAGHEETVNRSPKIGLRAGGLVRVLDRGRTELFVGLEAGADYTSFDETDRFDDVALSRLRVLGGGRVAVLHGRSLAFIRGGVGVDRITADFSGLLETLCGDPTVSGRAVEGGLGAGRRFGHVVLGAQIGVSVGDHRDQRPACVGVEGLVIDVLDNENTDIDLSLFAAFAL